MTIFLEAKYLILGLKLKVYFGTFRISTGKYSNINVKEEKGNSHYKI